MLDHFSKVVSYVFILNKHDKLQTDIDITQIEYTYIALEIHFFFCFFYFLGPLDHLSKSHGVVDTLRSYQAFHADWRSPHSQTMKELKNKQKTFDASTWIWTADLPVAMPMRRLLDHSDPHHEHN